MAAKKKVKAKRDAEEARENERIRRKAGQDQAQARAELQIKEAEKQAMMRKRERIEEAKAKDRVRQQIEADKRARAEKAAREKELRERGPTDVSAVAAGQSATKTGGAATATGGSSKNYDSARLQIRKQGLPPMTTTMEGTKTLKDVEAFVREQQPSLGEVVFSSTFPRCVFSPPVCVRADTDTGRKQKNIRTGRDGQDIARTRPLPIRCLDAAMKAYLVPTSRNVHGQSEPFSMTDDRDPG